MKTQELWKHQNWLTEINKIKINMVIMYGYMEVYLPYALESSYFKDHETFT